MTANIPSEGSGFKSFVSSASQTMQTGLGSLRDKMPSTSSMRDSIVSGGASIGRGLSSAKRSLSGKFESVRGGNHMERAGNQARKAGRNTAKFCRTNWQRSSGFRAASKRSLKALGVRCRENMGPFLLGRGYWGHKSPSASSEMLARHNEADDGWTRESIYEDKELMTSMGRWAENNQSIVYDDSRNALHLLRSVSKLESQQGHIPTVAKEFKEIVDYFIAPASDADYSGDVGFDDTLKDRARELRDTPKDERDAAWRDEVMKFLKNDVMSAIDNMEVLFDVTNEFQKAHRQD